MKKEKQVCGREFDAICVCPLINLGQQPMKMHTEVTLLRSTKENAFKIVCLN